jgi:beta-phosphoglucomutase family hydrolase
MSEQKRAIIWDLDGTLIDSSALHWEAWQEVMTAENLRLTYEEYVADFGKRNDEILRGRLGERITEADIERITRVKEERYRELLRTRGLKLLPGAEYWLRELKAGEWLQALASSSPRVNIDAVFAALGIARFFDVVVSSEEVKQGKPHPDVFLEAAGKLNVAPPRCIVVEDAPAGIEAAHRAGMKAIGVRTTHPGLEADWVVESLDKLQFSVFSF